MKLVFVFLVLFYFLNRISAQCAIFTDCASCITNSTGSCGWCDSAQVCLPSGTFTVQGITTNGAQFCSSSLSGKFETQTSSCSNATCRTYLFNCSACITDSNCGFCDISGYGSCFGSSIQAVCQYAKGQYASFGGTCPNLSSSCFFLNGESACSRNSNCGYCSIMGGTQGICLDLSTGSSICTSFLFNGTWTGTFSTTGTVTTAYPPLTTGSNSPSNGAQELAISIFAFLVSLLVLF